MGNYSLMLVLAGVVVGSTMLFSSRKASQGADEELTQHTFKTVAREAAISGLNMTVRRLVADDGSWHDSLVTNSTAYSYTTVAYANTSTFTTSVMASGRGYGAGEVAGTCFIDTVDVVSTGYTAPFGKVGVEYETDRRMASHKVEATYVRTCSDDAGAPPWSEYATVSDQRFDIDGEIRVFSVDQSKNADVHSNTRMYVTNPAEIEGFGSQSRSSGGGCSIPCDDIFLPNDDDNGSDSNFLRGEPLVEIPFFDHTVWEPKASYKEGSVSINSNTTIDFTDYQGVTGYGTQADPFIWYIDGDLTINADYLQVIGYVMIVVKDGVKINGDAQLITGAPAGQFPPPSTYASANKDAMRAWIDSNMPNGTTMGLYAAGCYEANCDSNYGIHLDGKNVTVGQIFANNEIFINGDATVVGAITARASMRYNSKNVIWYTGGDSSILFGGSGSQLPDGIRMLVFVEF